MVADALSRKGQHSLNTMISTQLGILRDLMNIGTGLVVRGLIDGLSSALEV